MSESEDNSENEEQNSPQYTVTLNGREYEMTEEWREAIQERAKLEYEENHLFSCWWRIATSEDEKDSDTVHEEGDPILVIETEGPMVPWDKLDQLELEMQDVSSYQEHDTGSGSDVDEGNGMRTIKPGEVDDGGSNDEDPEVERLHFGLTPQSFEEVPSPDGEQGERVPPKPDQFDEPTMVMWVPEDPSLEHTWSAGQAITPMHNWVEWNVQQRANQPQPTEDKADCHDRFESMAKHYGCEKIRELKPKQKPSGSTESEKSGSVERKGEKSFEEGKYGGNNWRV